MQTKNLFKFTNRIFALSLSVFAIWSCHSVADKVGSSGSSYEIFVVCDNDKWDGAIGDTLRSIMQQPVEMINQYEPEFSLFHVRQADPGSVVGRHRNLLIVTSGSEFKTSSFTVVYDVYSAPQIIVSITGSTDASIAQYMDENRIELLQVFELAERNRAIEKNRKYSERSLVELVERKFGMHIEIPKGYRLRTQGDDFVWISNELSMISQGFFIYSYPCRGMEDFDKEHFVARRNEFASRIPGPSDGSYMITYTDDPDLTPVVRHMAIANRNWYKMSGFWEVHGDFMGGPFFCYSTLDQKNNRIVALDCYLYSPKHPKRNYLRQLESLIYSVDFQKQGSK